MVHKKVTILVALYKAGNFLEAKLETLSAQTAIEQCQIVLLNCQNLDNESSIYNKFRAKYTDTIIIEYYQYHRLYSTWNDAIRLTKSDYITNSNCDDMLHPECLESLIDALDKNHDCDVAHTDYYATDIPNQQWPNWSYHGLIETQYPLGTAGPCPMWRRNLHDKYGLFGNYRTIGDARMWEKWYANNVKFIRVPSPLALYYHATSHNLETRTDDETGLPLRLMDLRDDATQDVQ